MTVATHVIYLWTNSRPAFCEAFYPGNEQTSWTGLPSDLRNRPPLGNGQRSQKLEKRTGMLNSRLKKAWIGFSSKP